MGKWASILSLLFVFSISSDYRLHLGGFLIHPYLVVLPFAFFFTGFSSFTIPRSVLIPLLLFFLIFSLGSLQNRSPLDEIIKVGASVMTFVFFASAVKSEKDLRIISLGFILCAVVIGYLGFGKSESGAEHRLSGINVLEGIGNKNAQSLFTLPGIFFIILLITLYFKRNKYGMLALLILCMFFIVVSIFLSANRSGWVGLIIIAFAYLAYLRFSVSTFVIIGILSVFSYFAINRYAKDIVEHKIDKTIDGYKSDDGRLILIKESLKVGLENPIIGVGMDELHRSMNKAVRSSSLESGLTDTHFLTGYLFGATGIFSVFFFYLFLFRLTRKNILSFNLKRMDLDARVLIISFVILFFVRSFFTREILYSPTFISGMGLVYSYYLFKSRQVYQLAQNG